MLASPLLRIIAIAVLALAATAADAATESRVALVVGNARYAEAPLKNPANDARAMAASLRERGFTVILRVDATKQQMEAAIIEFGEKLGEGATGLFFFAGHGMQVQGRNYIIPTDAKLTAEQRIKLEAIDVDAVLDQMQGARSRVNVVILDACRNNPFERRFRSTSGGLAQINAPEGTLIAYATAPGRVAADGEGENGLYTRELLRALRAPGLKVEDVFKQVRINVARASNGAQMPWEASSLVGDFYFLPPAPVAAAPLTNTETQFWNSIRNGNEPAEYRAYLTRYPKGEFAEQAQMRLASLEKAGMDAVERTRAEAAEKARLEVEWIRREGAEQSRLEIEKARREATENTRAEIEKARLAAVSAVRTEPSQPATRPLHDVLNGRYFAVIAGATWNDADITASLDISGLQIKGSAFHRGPCPFSGRLNPDGTTQFRIDCARVADALVIQLEGRFGPLGDSQEIVGETSFRSSDRRTGKIMWQPEKVPSGGGANSTPATPLQRAALPSPISDFGGVYKAKFTLIGTTGFFDFDALIEVTSGGEILGKSSSSGGTGYDSCTLSGRLNTRSGDVNGMSMNCRWINAQFRGAFVLNTQTGRIEGKTEATAVSDGRAVPVVWRP